MQKIRYLYKNILNCNNIDMDLNEKILSVFKKMINDIMDVYPEEKGSIYETYESVMNMETLNLDECELLKKFMNNINKYNTKITNKDIEAINDELIEGIPLKKIWKSDISDSVKDEIWKYLQTFCIININLNSSKELQELLNGDTKKIDPENRKDLKDLKHIKKLKESISTINEKKINENDMNGINDIFSNTGIGQLAKEIAEGLNFEEMLGQNSDLDSGEQNMEDVMQNIMNPANFMNLFQNINTKVQDKIQSGDIDESILTGEAQNLYGNFQNNPMFQSMMNNPEFKKCQEQMNKDMKDSGESDGNDNSVETSIKKDDEKNAVETTKKNKSIKVEKLDENQKVVPQNKTQERLQKKLAAKQKNNNNEKKKIVIEGEKKKSVKTDNVKVEKTK